MVLWAPKLIIAAIAALFFLVGSVCCYLAWKFVRFKRQLTSFTRSLEGRVQVHAFRGNPRDQVIEVETEEKKIIYH